MAQSAARSGFIQVYTGNGKGKTTAGLGLALRARAVGKRVAIVFFDKGGEHYSERALLGKIGVDWFAYGLDRIDPKTDRFRFGVIPDDIAQAEAGIAKARELLTSTSQTPRVKESLSRTFNLQKVREPFSFASPLPASAGGGGIEGGEVSEQCRYDLVILDEINTTVALGMLSERSVEELLDCKHKSTELVLTGRTEVTRERASSHLPGKPWPGGPEQQRWLSYFDRADLITEMRLHEHYFYHGAPAREGIDY